ncbi:MAG: redoxin domain-containing protein [SAR202 cluster bacterium]|nr:redoxin domain-containing protein [SAR202 cluster bacterium]
MSKFRLAPVWAFTLVAVTALAVACSNGGPPPVDVAPTATTARAAATPAGQASAQSTPTQQAGPLPTPVAAGTPLPADAYGPAPELAGTGEWLNSEPFTLASQRGKVVLVDFWTYTCINCLRTLPYLKDWHGRYADKGLVILGVHTPEFDFEKYIDNVSRAVNDLGIEYPVVQDNGYATWQAFSNQYWPAKYMIDKDGLVRYVHFGEGAYEETEQYIRKLLAEVYASVNEVPVVPKPDPEVDPLAMPDNVLLALTRELYAGYRRNDSAVRFGNPPYIVQPEFYENPLMAATYKDPGDHSNHFIYVQGEWETTDEYLRHARATQNYEDYVAIKFYANEVNVVLGLHFGGQYDVKVAIDGVPLKREEAGTAIKWDQDGNSYLTVTTEDMYHIVDLESYQGRELRLSSNADNFSVFAFTFGAYMQ